LGVLIVLAALFVAACASGPLTVKDAWARPGVAGGNSAVYFVVDNPSGEADTLLSASTSAAAVVELHETMMHSNETMSMQPIKEVPIPAGDKVKFEPGGKHVMLINLPADLKEGDTLQLSLTFAQVGKIELEVPVRQP
jgi:hypothetical protein